MSSKLSSCGWRAEASARNKIKMEWLPSIWNWSEVEISSFFSLGFRNCIPRFRGSLDRDVDSIDDSWKYCCKFYSKIYIIVPAKSAVHSGATNHSAGHAREANHSASDPDDLSALLLLFLPGVIIYEQNKSLVKLTVAPSSECSNLCDGVIWLSHSASYNIHMWKTLRRKKSVSDGRNPCRCGDFDKGCILHYNPSIFTRQNVIISEWHAWYFEVSVVAQ